MKIAEDKNTKRKVVVKLSKIELMGFLTEIIASTQKINLEDFDNHETSLKIDKRPDEDDGYATFTLILS